MERLNTGSFKTMDCLMQIISRTISLKIVSLWLPFVLYRSLQQAVNHIVVHRLRLDTRVFTFYTFLKLDPHLLTMAVVLCEYNILKISGVYLEIWGFAGIFCFWPFLEGKNLGENTKILIFAITRGKIVQSSSSFRQISAF